MTDERTVRKILKKKKIARNSSLMIYMAGWPIDDLQETKQMLYAHAGSQTVQISLIVRNFNQIRRIDWITLVNYDELIRHSDRLSVDAFLAKFVSIERVVVGQQVDSEANFNKFLKKCKLLKELTITNSPFGQKFYEKLYRYCAKLEVLQIELGQQQIKLDFLANHNHLWKFTINRELDLAIIDRLIQLKPKCRFNLRFKRNDTWVQLYQDSNGWNLEFKGHIFQYSLYSNSKENFSIVKALNELFKLA